MAKLVKRIRFVKQDPTALLNIDQELEASTINEGVISANYRVLNSSAKAVGVFGSSALSYVGASNDL